MPNGRTIEPGLKKKLERLVEQLSGAFAGRLKSVIVFGSAAGGDFLPDRSDINLRQGCLNRQLQPELLLKQSFKSFLPVFGGLLELKGVEKPADKSSLLSAVCQNFGLNNDLWQSLLKISNGVLRPSLAEINDLLEAYINDVSKAGRVIDQLK